VWAYPSIGKIAWNELTREQIGEVLVKLRAAERSLPSGAKLTALGHCFAVASMNSCRALIFRDRGSSAPSS
jgi:hypothetical protein